MSPSNLCVFQDSQLFWWGLSWFCGLRFVWCVSQASQRRYFFCDALWLMYLAYFLLESVSQTSTLSSWTCTLFPRPFNINDIMPSWDPVWYFIIPDLSSSSSFLYLRTWFVRFSTQFLPHLPVSRICHDSKRKRKISDSIVWHKPVHPQTNPKRNMTTQQRNQKLPITQRLRIDLGRSVGVTIATQLVWLNRFTGFQPSH